MVILGGWNPGAHAPGYSSVATPRLKALVSWVTAWSYFVVVSRGIAGGALITIFFRGTLCLNRAVATMRTDATAHSIAHQSPNRTRGVRPVIGCTDSVRNPVSPTSSCDTTFPDGSMKPEMPVSAALANQRRVSAGRTSRRW